MDKENELFDHTFRRKLKAFYSFDEGNRRGGDHGYRASGRSTLLARVLLETAIESGRTIELNDHHCEARTIRVANGHLADMVRDLVDSYRAMGIIIDLEFQMREGTFSARLVCHNDMGREEYANARIVPADLPTKVVKQVSNRKLLLLLQ